MSSIENPTQTETIGPFNNILYVRYRGQFRGSTGENREFSVPYEITVPQISSEGQRVLVFEPPHLTSGLVARDGVLGERFLFNNGYSHASVGFGNRAGHILDPKPNFELRIRGNIVKVLDRNSTEQEVIDGAIMREFASELRRESVRFGQVSQIYAVGFSDSGNTVHRIYKPFGHRFFDLTLAGTADYFEPVKLRDQSPVIVLNTEMDFDAKAISNPDFPAYHYYSIAGGPHIPDSNLSRLVFTGQPRPAVAGTTPINWLPIGRALFRAGDNFVRHGKQLPASATFRLNSSGQIMRDNRQNALGGIRHPAVQLGEARFIASVDRNGWDLFGDYRNPRQLGGSEFPEYLRSFKRATDELFDGGYLTTGGRERLHREAQLKPGNTYTLNYREGLLLPTQ